MNELQILKIDEEFKKLIPPLTNEELDQLEKNIIRDGCREPLVTWNGYIVDGHNRYSICSKNNIEFKIEEKEFDSRENVIEWIILNQFGRRNLQNFVRSELALRLQPIFRKNARERQLSTLKQNLTDVQNSAPREKEQGKVRDELAEIAGVSHDTIEKTVKILKQGTEEQINRARQGGKGNSVNAIFNEVKGVSAESKTCCMCGKEKPASEFNRGYTECKRCNSSRTSSKMSMKEARELNEKYPDEMLNAFYEEMKNPLPETEEDRIIAHSSISKELEGIVNNFNIDINKFLFSEDIVKSESFLKPLLERTISNLTQINNYIKENEL